MEIGSYPTFTEEGELNTERELKIEGRRPRCEVLGCRMCCPSHKGEVLRLLRGQSAESVDFWLSIVTTAMWILRDEAEKESRRKCLGS